MSNERRSPERASAPAGRVFGCLVTCTDAPAPPAAGLAGIVHQADADGNQEALAPPQVRAGARKPPRHRDVCLTFSSLCRLPPPRAAPLHAQSPSFRRTPRIPPKKQRKQARKQDRQSRGLFASLFCCVSADPAVRLRPRKLPIRADTHLNLPTPAPGLRVQASYAVNAPPVRASPLAPPPTPRAASPRSAPTPLQYADLLPPLAPEDTGRKTLVLDLDETLVHSSFRVRAPPPLLPPAAALTRGRARSRCPTRTTSSP